MQFISIFVVSLWLVPCFSKSLNNGDFDLSTERLGSPDNRLPTNNFSWARGNVPCSQLLKQCTEYIQLLPSHAEQLVRPAVALGLIQVGCLSEHDPFLAELIMGENATRLFQLLSQQWQTFSYTPYWKKNTLDNEYLRFNLDSLAPPSLSRQPQKCSGFWEGKKNVALNGVDLKLHQSLHDAKLYCYILGDSCAGVTLDGFGKYHTVARIGGHIIPQVGAHLWLHRCTGAHVRRRSVSSECKNEREENIHNVMQWVPLISGWYNAGSAIYYASKGCSELAEERAVEATVDLGYDTLLSATGGASSVIGLGAGVAIRPALKSGVRSAIAYFKQDPQTAEQ
ncbi:uncharacterized protein LOC121400047 [Xenopus laevis]|uniref:Apolipoprotein F n=2 Tax=Xenopus laevis TaxID=8355 RepID=A0A974HZA8_XENLA|nr:uncharacterized protein LOC121400047 [Xenopus laevis]OCT95703.1 hypothetical protein XELAEV_18013391mg [Xenopus laevis]